MLNKDGNTEDVYNERPPPYNPDFFVHTDHATTCRFEPPYYNPDLVEHVVWDEHLAARQEETSETQQRNEHFEYEHETQEQYSSPCTRSSWEATRRVARNVYTKIQSLDEKHQITHKTRKGAVAVYQSTKKATITASHKIREFDEKHHVVAKSKQTIGQGSLYITKFLRRSV